MKLSSAVVGAASGTQTAAVATAATRSPDFKLTDAWSRPHDRVLPADEWENPIKDWQVARGGAGS